MWSGGNYWDKTGFDGTKSSSRCTTCFERVNKKSFSHAAKFCCWLPKSPEPEAMFWYPSWRHQMETFSTLLALLRGIHRSPVDSPHKSQWRGALMVSLVCAWTNYWANNRHASDLRRHCTHYDVTVLKTTTLASQEISRSDAGAGNCLWCKCEPVNWRVWRGNLIFIPLMATRRARPGISVRRIPKKMQ